MTDMELGLVTGKIVPVVVGDEVLRTKGHPRSIMCPIMGNGIHCFRVC